MSYLKEFRAEANERLDLYDEAEDKQEAGKILLDWLAEKQLKSYRNGQESRKSGQGQRR